MIDCANPTSGELWREITLFACSIEITVFGFDGSSPGSWNQPSSALSRCQISKRPSMLMVAPRPFTASP